MKKVLLVVSILFLLIISCKSKSVVVEKPIAKEINYIPYYLKVYEAKDYFDIKNNTKAFEILDSLFTAYEPNEMPTIYEMDIYCELSVSLKRYNKKILKKVLTTSVVKFGRKPYLIDDIDSFWNEIIIQSGIKRKDFDNLYNKYLSGINYTLKDTIVAMYNRDQTFRRKDSNYNPLKFDSIDKVNSNMLLHILKKYGYPRENIVGGMELINPVKPNHLSTVLMHLDYDIYNNDLMVLLYLELKKGNLFPINYAMMLDRIYAANKEKMSDYVYLGTYKNLPIDTTTTNISRKLIGLPSLK